MLDKKNKTKKDDLITFHRFFNQVSLVGFNSIDMDILFFIISKIKNKKFTAVTISVDEIIKAIDVKKTRLKNKKRFLENIDLFCDKLQSSFLQIFFIDDEKMVKKRINLFNISSVYENNLLVSIIVKTTPEAKKFFNNFNYSKNVNIVNFSLKDFCSLTSKYSKNLFRIFKEIEFSKNHIFNSYLFESVMLIPDSYKNSKNINSKVLSSAVNELNKKNLFNQKVVVEFKKNDDGNKECLDFYKLSFM